MAWKTLQFHLTGDAPLIMHNGQLADPLNVWAKKLKAISGQRKKTDSQYEEMSRIEFFGGLYLSKEHGPIIPADLIDACVVEAARKSREGVLAKSGFFTSAHSRLEYEGPRTDDELWQDEVWRIVKRVTIGQSSVMRTRPIFQQWQATVTIQHEDTVVNAARVAAWFAVAGALVGLGDWRPRFGRFQAVSL